tara:strand:- start:786 stop:1154 length:369 start_codon:yes stop_codon:yes gene_type:complete
MVLTENQMKKLLTKVIDIGNHVEKACKAQIIQALHSSNVNITSRSIKACLECKETIDIASFFIANKSPNTKSCLSLSIKTVKTCIKECKKLENYKCCKNTSKYCVKVCNEYLELLDKLKKNI